jgi:hypothetical protein
MVKCDECGQLIEEGEYWNWEGWTFCDRWCFIQWHFAKGLKIEVVGSGER